MDLSMAIDLRCVCSSCGSRIGVSTKLVGWSVIRNLVKEETEKGRGEEEVLGELRKRIDSGEEFAQFSPFELTFDPVTGTLSFPLWCERCDMVVQTSITLEEMGELVEQSVSERRN